MMESVGKIKLTKSVYIFAAKVIELEPYPGLGLELGLFLYLFPSYASRGEG